MAHQKIMISVVPEKLIPVDDYIYRLNKKLSKKGKKKTNRSEFLIESAEMRIEAEKRKRRV